MGRLAGKVAVVSGAARGQGRAHAVKLASEGADIVAFDLCEGFRYTRSPAATEAELQETHALVEKLGQRCISAKADARDLPALESLAARAMDEFGRVDVLVVNHGIWVVDKNSWELPEESWQESIDVLLTGAWKVAKAFIPRIIDGGRGGAVVFTSSINAFAPQPSAVAYCAAKSGVVMLTKVLAHECGPHDIRVNAVHPGNIDTPMIQGGNVEKSLEYRPYFFGGQPRKLLPPDQIPPEAIADAVAWLVSDEARFVTGISLPVDNGRLAW